MTTTKVNITQYDNERLGTTWWVVNWGPGMTQTELFPTYMEAIEFARDGKRSSVDPLVTL